jgi:amino acid transporter
MISFHNTTARYTFALGREAVIPPVFARISRATNAPWVASLTQTTFGLAVIIAYAQAGWDPLTKLSATVSMSRSNWACTEAASGWS